MFNISHISRKCTTAVASAAVVASAFTGTPAHAEPSKYNGPLAPALLNSSEIPRGYSISQNPIANLTTNSGGGVGLIVKLIQRSLIQPPQCSHFLHPLFQSYGNRIPPYLVKYLQRGRGDMLNEIANSLTPRTDTIAIALVRKALPADFDQKFLKGINGCRRFSGTSNQQNTINIRGSITDAGRRTLPSREIMYTIHDIYDLKGADGLLPIGSHQNQYVSLTSARGLTVLAIAPTADLSRQLTALAVQKLHRIN